MYGQQINLSQCNTALSITNYIPYASSESDSTKLDRVNRHLKLQMYQIEVNKRNDDS